MKKLSVIVILALLASVAQANGTLSGKATFKGTAPARKAIDATADPNCCKDHPNPQTEDIIVDKDNNLKNVMIYIKEGLPEGQEYPAPKEAAVMDQVGCVYTPHVMGMQVGQPLEVRNSDNTLHNVHGLPRVASEFNQSQPKKGNSNVFNFKEPEMPGFILKCDVHSWMKAYVWVFPHPFFAISKDDGTFSIAKLPPGEYTIEAWHERLGKQSHKVKIEAGKTAELPLTFEPRKRN